MSDMELLIIISSRDSGPIVTPLAAACGRSGISWAAFFTNDGVATLVDENLVKALGSASKAIACQESWNEHMAKNHCPIELGSQTGNSALVGTAKKVLSL